MTNSEITSFIKQLSKNWNQDLTIIDFTQLEISGFEKDFMADYRRYYESEFHWDKVVCFRGLIATFFYRLSRQFFLIGEEELALKLSTFSFYFTGMELYYSADIGVGLKFNHGIGSVIGARSIVGENCLFHHNVTLGEKNGRPTLGNNITVYPGALIVGGIEVGDNCVIGGNSFLDKSLPPNSIHK